MDIRPARSDGSVGDADYSRFGLVEKGWITGPRGTKYGSSGIIVNCPPVYRFL
jgi:hypothetical protein